MEIRRLSDEWEIYSTMSYFDYKSPELDLFGWVDCNNPKDRVKWIVKYARMWDVYNQGRWIGYMAATSHYKGRWVFHFAAISDIDHKSVIPYAWRLFLKQARKKNVKMVAVYIPDDRADIRRLARIFKFKHFFGHLWALNLNLKHLKSSR